VSYCWAASYREETRLFHNTKLFHMAVGLISKPRNTSSQFTYHLLASLTAGWWIKVSVLIPGIIKRCSRCYVSPADSIAAVGSNFSCCPQCVNCHDLPCLMVNIICRSAIFDASPDSILTLGLWKWFFLNDFIICRKCIFPSSAKDSNDSLNLC